MNDILTDQKLVIELWFHQEQVAMHFNELIIQYRLQLLGGAGALGAVATFFVQSNGDERTRYKLRYMLSILMFIVIFAAAILDLYYYNQLLKGAVASLIEFESKYSYLNLSTHIRSEFTGIERYAVYLWYGSVLLPLAWLGFRSWRKYVKLNATDG